MRIQFSVNVFFTKFLKVKKFIVEAVIIVPLLSKNHSLQALLTAELIGYYLLWFLNFPK